jgi:hypothetical protein
VENDLSAELAGSEERQGHVPNRIQWLDITDSCWSIGEVVNDW